MSKPEFTIESNKSNPRIANVFSLTRDKEGNEYTIYFAQRYVKHNFAEKDGALIDVPTTEFEDVATISMSRKQVKALSKLLENALGESEKEQIV